MRTDADIASALARGTAAIAAASPAPPAEHVHELAQRRRRRRHMRWGGAAACLAVAAAGGALVLAANSQPPDSLIADGTVDSGPVRTLEIGEWTARMLAESFPRTADRPQASDTAVVLNSLDTAKGEIVLIGIDLPSGKRCVLLKYTAERTAGGGGGGRCVGKGDDPYATKPFDISGSQEMNPQGINTSVVFGAVPAGTARLELRAPSGRVTTVETTDGGAAYGNRAFFLAQWPLPTAVSVTGFDAAGRETGRTQVTF